jgi:FKBP12-rapamycin binding domain
VLVHWGPKHCLLETAKSLCQAYGRELAEAGEWCRKYRASRKDSDLHQAWDLCAF